jgi:hypothetical protein
MLAPVYQGCQMAYFQTKHFNFGKFWSVLQSKMLVYFTTYRPILRLFSVFCGHLVYFMGIWYIFPRLGIFYHEKSDNTAVYLGNFLGKQ